MVVFYKKLKKPENIDRLMAESEERIWENQLSGYVIVNVWD